MFYPDGTASPSLHVWNYVKTGAVSNEVSVEGMGADLTQEVLANSTFELPKTLDVMYSDETKAEEITWSKGGLTDNTKYYDASGNEIKINIGKTYIALVPDDAWGDLVVE